MNITRAPQAKARGSLWRRIRALFARRPIAYCSRCGNALDNGQRLPSSIDAVCAGPGNIADPGEPPVIVCIRFLRVWG